MICRQCKVDKPSGDYYWKSNGRVAYGQDCRDCLKVKWATPEWKDRQRDNNLKRLYGISAKEYDALLEKQNGVCAICKQESDATGKNSKLHVDHDHSTEMVRGLVCYRCNIAMGFLSEDWDRIYKILDYLNIHSFQLKI